MAEDPTSGEVGRALDMLREQIRDDIRTVREDLSTFRSETNLRIDKVVAADVYAADRRADQIRFDSLQSDVTSMKQAKADRAANRKWVIAAVLVPIGIGLIDLYCLIKGVR